MPRYRIELRIIVREIWECEAEDPDAAELNWMVKPDSFIFDREEIDQKLVKVYPVDDTPRPESPAACLS